MRQKYKEHDSLFKGIYFDVNYTLENKLDISLVSNVTGLTEKEIIKSVKRKQTANRKPKTGT